MSFAPPKPILKDGNILACPLKDDRADIPKLSKSFAESLFDIATSTIEEKGDYDAFVNADLGEE